VHVSALEWKSTDPTGSPDSGDRDSGKHDFEIRLGPKSSDRTVTFIVGHSSIKLGETNFRQPERWSDDIESCSPKRENDTKIVSLGEMSNW
jgi:hypothetical protein